MTVQTDSRTTAAAQDAAPLTATSAPAEPLALPAPADDSSWVDYSDAPPEMVIDLGDYPPPPEPPPVTYSAEDVAAVAAAAWHAASAQHQAPPVPPRAFTGPVQRPYPRGCVLWAAAWLLLCGAAVVYGLAIGDVGGAFTTIGACAIGLVLVALVRRGEG